jgi:hypothetical protein
VLLNSFFPSLAPFIVLRVQRRTRWGGHELPKVSPGARHARPFTPCGRTNRETALRPFQGWPACRMGSLRLSSTLLDTPNHPPVVLRVGEFMSSVSTWRLFRLMSCLWFRGLRGASPGEADEAFFWTCVGQCRPAAHCSLKVLDFGDGLLCNYGRKKKFERFKSFLSSI